MYLSKTLTDRLLANDDNDKYSMLAITITLTNHRQSEELSE